MVVFWPTFPHPWTEDSQSANQIYQTLLHLSCSIQYAYTSKHQSRETLSNLLSFLQYLQQNVTTKVQIDVFNVMESSPEQPPLHISFLASFLACRAGSHLRRLTFSGQKLQRPRQRRTTIKPGDCPCDRGFLSDVNVLEQLPLFSHLHFGVRSGRPAGLCLV